MSQTIRTVNVSLCRTLFTDRFMARRYCSISVPGGKNKLNDDLQSEAIDQRSIKMFSVEANTLANRFRSKQYQLQCIGGDAAHKEDLHPQSMVCVNIGVDDRGNVNWHYMVPQLNNKVLLGAVAVTFEGITPGSNLVRPGSAVVRYHLLLKKETMTEDDLLTFWVCVAILVSIVAAIKISIFSNGETRVCTSDTTETSNAIKMDRSRRVQSPTIIINTANPSRSTKKDGSDNSSSYSSSTGIAKSSKSE